MFKAAVAVSSGTAPVVPSRRALANKVLQLRARGTGVNAGRQDVCEGVNFSPGNVAVWPGVGEPGGDIGERGSIREASRRARSFETGNVRRVGGICDHRVSRRYRRHFIDENERRSVREISGCRAGAQRRDQANRGVGTVATAITSCHIEVDLMSGATVIVARDRETPVFAGDYVVADGVCCVASP